MTTSASTSSQFQVSALPLEPFRSLFALSDEELLERGARRCQVSTKPGYPCRVSLQDAEPGESVILLTYTHHDVDSPYRASGPIYVRELAQTAELEVGQLPAVVEGRQLSLRAYNAKNLMRSATICDASNLSTRIETYFADPKVSYLQIHNALPGCFSCQIDRVPMDLRPDK